MLQSRRGGGTVFPHLLVLTGGPGGGKTTLVRELRADPAWARRHLALPEAISVVGQTGVLSQETLFQRMMVQVQIALEDSLRRSLPPGDGRAILCHRGSLDPLAYWLQRGWVEEEFFAYTGLRREEHYRRYVGVIHLVTAADGAPWAYRRWPDAHRPETPEAAIALDRLLERAWGDHPHYVRIDNAGRDWPAKRAAAQEALAHLLG